MGDVRLAAGADKDPFACYRFCRTVGKGDGQGLVIDKRRRAFIGLDIGEGVVVCFDLRAFGKLCLEPL